MWLVCVLNVTFTGIRIMANAAFWLRKDRSKFSKGRFARFREPKVWQPPKKVPIFELTALFQVHQHHPNPWEHQDPDHQLDGLLVAVAVVPMMA